MADVLSTLWHGVRDALLMGWEIGWALVFGFFISGIVQAWVPRELIQSRLGEGADGSRIQLTPLVLATGLGAASSSCSYAAVAITKSLFQKGASATNAVAFEVASTNLVWELGLVLWVLIGWQFTVAEYVGGIVMILISAVLLRRLIPPGLERQARKRARLADTGHEHHMAGESMTVRQRITSVSAWSDVAHNFRGDGQMLYREIGIGLLISGFVGQIHSHALHTIFLSGSPGLVQAVWGAVIGPVIAMLTFVCSVGNVPLAAVLWRGGASFAGVIAFLFADLVIPPLIVIYRRYYGGAFTVRLVALLLLSMVGAALIVEGLFSLAGLVPSTTAGAHVHLFAGVHFNYTLVLNALALILATGLFALTARRGATDPVCGMTVDRAKALTVQHHGTRVYFCCEGCRDAFVNAPDEYSAGPLAGAARVQGGSHGNPKHHIVTLPDSALHGHDD